MLDEYRADKRFEYGLNPPGDLRMLRSSLSLILLSLTLSAAAMAQGPCPTGEILGSAATRSSDLVCTVPQVYGPGGLVGTDNGGPLTATKFHEVHFQASSINSFGPINAEIGVQLSQVPLASPVSGFIFANGVMQEATSFGPVLADRAETLGRRRIFVGASYEYFDFDKADGVNLKSFGAVFNHEQEPTICATIPSTPCLGGEPIYTRDIIATQNRIDVKVHQVTLVGTYGLSDRLDVSVAVPVVDVRVAMRSNATIFNFEPPPVNHTFAPITDNPRETYISPFNAILTNSGSTLGIGDLRLRGKYVAWRDAKEKSAVAVGLDLRLPTGDAYNFLGSGTWGVRPFIIYSYSARVSPHASAGFEGNGNSILAGDVTTQPVTKAKLPDVFTYSVGADASPVRWLGLSADYIGTSLLNASRIENSTYTDFVGNTHQNVNTFVSTVNQSNISAGAKIRPMARLLITGNVLFRLNDAGLHFKPSPLIGVSYTF
jgi:Putative MetA-pathway of phenol degradation